jgi:hypothetical protein
MTFKSTAPGGLRVAGRLFEEVCVTFLAEWAAPYEWAAMYRSLGLQVVPGRAGEKRPLVDWLEFRNALVPPAQFDRWFDPKVGEHRMLRAMGLLTGACSHGLFVVDLDLKDDANGLEWWRTFCEVELGGIEPETWMAKSGGGGLHIYFQAPEGWIPPTFKAPAFGVDCRGQGGYIVAPPSMHPNGRIYDWVEGFEPWAIPLGDAPPELVAALDRLKGQGAASGTAGQREATATPATVKNDFGLDIDGREDKLRALAWAIVVDARRESPIRPTTAMLEAEINAAFDRYCVTTKSRLEARPGLDKAALLELEDRGISALWAKVSYALSKWDAEVAEAALVPKAEPVAEDRNTWGASLGGASLGGAGTGDQIPASKSVGSFKGEPPEREWLVPGWIARGEVNSLYGGGATGKSLLAYLLAHAMAIGAPWVGLPTVQGSSLLVSCEDDEDELHRRHSDIRKALGHVIGDPFGAARYLDRVGHNNLLATANGLGGLVNGPFMPELRIELEAHAPALLILDTLADVFGGNEIDRVQVNGFLKTCLGGLIRERREAGHELTILLLGHPSKSAMTDGSGFSGSTAWENGVRSRLYLSRPENSGPDERILSRGKANYAGGDDGELPLTWSGGIFVAVDKEAEQRVQQMASTVKNEVASAWAAGVPYMDGKGHPRYLHRAIRQRLDMPGQTGELIIQGLRRAMDEGAIYLSKNNAKRGWRTATD